VWNERHGREKNPNYCLLQYVPYLLREPITKDVWQLWCVLSSVNSNQSACIFAGILFFLVVFCFSSAISTTLLTVLHVTSLSSDVCAQHFRCTESSPRLFPTKSSIHSQLHRPEHQQTSGFYPLLPIFAAAIVQPQSRSETKHDGATASHPTPCG
jgi:hypothetical protein